MALPNTHHGYCRIREILADCKRILFIGIGGVSMSSLAELTLADGMEVWGSDRTESERLERLRGLGATVYCGHDVSHLEGVGAVVYTVAIDQSNPEYSEALLRGIPLISRSDYLGYLMMRYRNRIGIAGMNGKSTTTALCAHFLKGHGHPTVFCGAEAETLGNSTCVIGADRDMVIFEACEYMDSFLDFNPTLSVLLNLGMDHVDYFHSMEQIRESFLGFAMRTEEGGTVLYNADSRELVRAMENYRGRTLTFGVKKPADFTAENIRSVRGCRSFSFCFQGRELCRLKLSLPGEFQIYNTLAAASAAYLSGASPEEIAEKIATFDGVHRRMEYKGRLNGAAVYADYSHHPTAIKAVLESVSEMGYRRVLCAYQPHTYSRTAGLFEEFAAAFDDADLTYLADIYAARERNESGVTSRQLAERIGERAVYCGDFQTLAERLKQDATEGDLLLIMGAGDIEKVYPLISLK